jgi:glycine/D-amino acid oxidase-like deaminating enzyme
MTRAVSRRLFLGTSAALIGLSCKSRRGPGGSFVDDGGRRGHQLRSPFTPGTRARQERKPIVIVGGGIAGLSAAWRLQQRGFTDFVVLEMETQPGGNSRWGEHEIAPFPWAAHYVPVPGPEAAGLRAFFSDLGVLDGEAWNERALCFAPQERLYIHGRWQEGLDPQVGPTIRDRDQLARFDDRIREFRDTGAFTIPSSRGRATRAQAPGVTALDTLSMAAWMDREGFDSPYVRWWVEYGCRDDYGALMPDVSAWAGIHYHASRPVEEPGPLTWPEGNGWIVRRLLERLGSKVEPSVMVQGLQQQGREWTVTADIGVWTTENVVYAAPAFLLPYLTSGEYAPTELEYSPWLTANLVLDRWPRSTGAPPAWDNVIFDSPSVGYVVATHQSLTAHLPRTIWTYYWPLAQGAPRANRGWLQQQTWATLTERILADLRRGHPDIDDCVSRVDILRLGHGMIRPTVGFLSARSRQRLAAGDEGLFFAHSDVSGLSLFEEAHDGGVRAADRALARLGRFTLTV